MRQSLIAIFSAAGLVTLSGCGTDPAKQEPVQLQPGLYKLSYSGASPQPFGRRSTSPEKDEVCVSPSDADSFPQTYPRRHWSKLGASCDGPLTERVGNHIAGKVACSAMDGASGNVSVHFEGEVAEDSLDVSIEFKANLSGLPAAEAAKLDTSALNDLDLRMSLRRIGDCPA